MSKDEQRGGATDTELYRLWARARTRALMGLVDYPDLDEATMERATLAVIEQIERALSTGEVVAKDVADTFDRLLENRLRIEELKQEARTDLRERLRVAGEALTKNRDLPDIDMPASFEALEVELQHALRVMLGVVR